MSNSITLDKEWHILKFSDCIKSISRGLNPRDNFSLGKGSIKYITAKNLTALGTIDFSKCDYIDEKAKIIINKRSGIKVGSILFSSRAPIGQCHLINEKPDDYDIGESIFSITVNKNVVLPEYLRLYLSSDYFIKAASKNITGSVILEIRTTDLMNTNVIVPPHDIQKHIADCLTSIDSKITNNNAIISELEAMANTLYDYWFLQFDFPDDNGKPYKSSGGKMVWSEEMKREIPEGWEVKELGSLFTSNRGVSYNSATLEGSGVPMINLASFTPQGNYNPAGLKSYSGEYTDEKVLKPFDLVMCNTQQTAIDFSKDIIGRAMLIPDLFKGDIVSSHHVTSIKPYDDNLNCFLCYLFNTKHFHKYVTGYANGTNIMGLIFSGVERYVNEVPPAKVLGKFTSLILGMEKKKSLIIKENQELASLRDFLLPMLMNGQVTFKEN